MICIGVSYKKTPIDIRQQFAFSKEEQIAFLSYLKNEHLITAGIILSTCNRCELYITCDRYDIEKIEQLLSLQKGISMEEIKKYCLYYTDQKAVYHLFKVVCGLDSMVLGEDEILRQVKDSYLFADTNGFTNSELNIIFQGAFHCAKLSKSETKLSETPISLGTLTANTIEHYLQSVDKERCKVLVIGATGKMGSIVAKDLIAKGYPVIGTKRRHHNAIYMMENEHMDWIDFDERYERISQVGVVVSATASPHYTITKEEFVKYSGNQKYMLIDLAVPYDIDKTLQFEPGIIRLDIDHFKSLSKENRNIKQGEIEKVESIITGCVEDVLKKLYICSFQEKMGNREENWFWKMIFYLRDILDSEPLYTVLCSIEKKENGR